MAAVSLMLRRLPRYFSPVTCTVRAFCSKVIQREDSLILLEEPFMFVSYLNTSRPSSIVELFLVFTKLATKRNLMWKTFSLMQPKNSTQERREGLKK